MYKLYLYLIALFFMYDCTGYAQTNITKAWVEANPLKNEEAVSTAERSSAHEVYLKNAVAVNDITRQFYGNLYLYTDNMDTQNYPAAIVFLLEAEKIALRSGNLSWQSAVKLRTGWVACIVQNDIPKAIEEYKMGAKLGAQAKDSLCMALCFEQVSNMYSGQKKYDSSQYYFDLAIPVLRRSKLMSLDAIYANYSELMVAEGKLDKALLYIDSAIQISQKESGKNRQIGFLSNRAVILFQLKQYDSAEVIFKYCMATNIENNWIGNLLNDYKGLSNNYNAKGNAAAAYEYLNKYQHLKDSLSGVEVNLKIANITAADKIEMDRLAAKSSLQKRNWIVAIASLLLIMALSFWRMQYSRAKKEQLKNKNSLTELTRILIEKNTQLIALEQANNIPAKNNILESTSPASENILTDDDQPNFENDLYNQRILTAEDWTSFKLYFDKAYPGYLFRLRNAYPKLTEAEERLFLFIKLNLTNKEAAAILGISADSVKKTRTRLRKRLELNEEELLDDFVKKF